MEEIRSLDAEVIAISVDPVEANNKLSRKHGLAFPILADVEGQVMDLFGVRHQGGNPMGEHDIARPASFILDRNGQVAWTYLPDNWRVRVRPETVLEQLRALE